MVPDKEKRFFKRDLPEVRIKDPPEEDPEGKRGKYELQKPAEHDQDLYPGVLPPGLKYTAKMHSFRLAKSIFPLKYLKNYTCNFMYLYQLGI
jgi:hypothetical protein